MRTTISRISIIILVIFVLILTVASTASAQDKKPNLVYFLVDKPGIG